MAGLLILPEVVTIQWEGEEEEEEQNRHLVDPVAYTIVQELVDHPLHKFLCIKRENHHITPIPVTIGEILFFLAPFFQSLKSLT